MMDLSEVEFMLFYQIGQCLEGRIQRQIFHNFKFEKGIDGIFTF